MKKNKRQVWLELSRIEVLVWPTWLSLCHFCKYAEWIGECDIAALVCNHRLDIVAENSNDVWGGDDCWGFVPYTSLDITAEFISHKLQGKNVNLPSREGFKELNENT